MTTDPPHDKLPPDLQALVEEINGSLARPNASRFRFERFEVLDYKIGGMGLVLQGRDRDLNRLVAIKLWIRDEPGAAQFLLAEARALAQVSHPNVVTIYDIRTWEGRFYFVMEWVDGIDGADWMIERRPWQEIRDVFVQAARGLQAAHAADVVHRDFKPHNILLGLDGRVRVCDFGIAEIVGDGTEAVVTGTTEYMAPEQLLGAIGDARSDQFSFCVSLWQALFGERPFEGSTAAELYESIRVGFIAADLDQPDRPRWLTNTVLYGLAFDPDDRYESMREIVQALEDERDPDDDGDEDLVLDGPEQPLDHGDAVAPETPRPVSHPCAALRNDEEGRAITLGGSASSAPPVPGSAWSQVGRWMAVGAGLGSLVAVFAFMAGGWWATWMLERASHDGTKDEAEVVVGDEIIITPEEVIWHVEAGTYDENVEERWTKQYNRWLLEGRPTYDDNLDIATAFLQRAKRLKERGEADAAVEASVDAKWWSDAARTDLENADRSTKPADDLAELIRQFEDEPANPDQLKQVTDPSALLAP